MQILYKYICQQMHRGSIYALFEVAKQHGAVKKCLTSKEQAGAKVFAQFRKSPSAKNDATFDLPVIARVGRGVAGGVAAGITTRVAAKTDCQVIIAVLTYCSV